MIRLRRYLHDTTNQGNSPRQHRLRVAPVILPSVIGHCLRRTAAYTAVLGLVSLAWLPPAHAHRGAHDGDDHDSEVVHRHLGWHQAVRSTADIDHPDDEDARYISDVFTATRPAQAVDTGQLLAVVVDGLDLTSTSPEHSPLSARTLRTHDPPWRSSSTLRGPPVVLA